MVFSIDRAIKLPWPKQAEPSAHFHIKHNSLALYLNCAKYLGSACSFGLPK